MAKRETDKRFINRVTHSERLPKFNPKGTRSGIVVVYSAKGKRRVKKAGE
jgi:hypothetical protein